MGTPKDASTLNVGTSKDAEAEAMVQERRQIKKLHRKAKKERNKNNRRMRADGGRATNGELRDSDKVELSGPTGAEAEPCFSRCSTPSISSNSSSSDSLPSEVMDCGERNQSPLEEGSSSDEADEESDSKNQCKPHTLLSSETISFRCICNSR